MSYAVATGKGTTDVYLHIQPKASKTRICGIHDGRLKVAVNAPPVEGKANKEMVSYLKKILGLPAKNLVITSGFHSRKKTVAISSMDVAEVKSLVEPMLADR